MHVCQCTSTLKDGSAHCCATLELALLQLLYVQLCVQQLIHCVCNQLDTCRDNDAVGIMPYLRLNLGL